MNVLSISNFEMYKDLEFFFNEMTVELDKHLTDDYKTCRNKDINATYIMKHFKFKNIWSIRKFGATRGHLKIDKNNIITEIEIYEDSGYENGKSNISCYTKDVLSVAKKYLGWKLETNNLEWSKQNG